MLSRFRSTTLVACVLLLSAAWAGYRWWFDPARVITRRLHLLADALSVPENEAGVERLAEVARLRFFFTPDVQVTYGDGVPGIVTRGALMGVAGTWRATAGGSTVRVARADVTVESETAAHARVEVEVSRRDRVAHTRDVHLVQLRLTPVEGEWMIAAAELPRADRAE